VGHPGAGEHPAGRRPARAAARRIVLASLTPLVAVLWRASRAAAAPPADGRIPSGVTLAEARAEFRRRHGRSPARATTSGGAIRDAEELLTEAVAEPSAAVRWVLLDEARKLGVAAGSAGIVGRAIRLASAEFEFDELGNEYLSLREIPLRALSPPRAKELAQAAEALATRSESDGRERLSLDSLALAVRAWQAAGIESQARGAAERHDRKVAAARERDPAGRGDVRTPLPFRGGSRDPER